MCSLLPRPSRAPRRRCPRATTTSSSVSWIPATGTERERLSRLAIASSRRRPKSAAEPRLTIRTDGPAGDVTVLRLRDPSRIAVDLSGFEVKGAKVRGSGSEKVRFGKLSGGARVVFDLGQSEVPKVAVRRTATGLTLSSPPASPAQAAVASAPPEVSAPAPLAPRSIEPIKPPTPAVAAVESPPAARPTAAVSPRGFGALA